MLRRQGYRTTVRKANSHQMPQLAQYMLLHLLTSILHSFAISIPALQAQTLMLTTHHQSQMNYTFGGYMRQCLLAVC